MAKDADDRSQIAKAYQWASRIMGVSLEMVLPGLLGYGIDHLIETGYVFTVLGFFAGLVLGMVHLVRMTK